MTDKPAKTEGEGLTPAAALALISREQRRIGARFGAGVPWIFGAWSVAWTAAFVVLFLDAQARGPMPGLSAAVAVGALALVAVGVSAIAGIRSGRGLRGTRGAVITGVVYGNLWWVGMLVIVLICFGLRAAGVGLGAIAVLWPALIAAFFGMMFVSAGLIWPAPPLLVIGFWMLAVGASSVFLRAPSHLLYVGIAGGVGLLGVAVWTAIWIRMSR